MWSSLHVQHRFSVSVTISAPNLAWKHSGLVVTLLWLLKLSALSAGKASSWAGTFQATGLLMDLGCQHQALQNLLHVVAPPCHSQQPGLLSLMAPSSSLCRSPALPFLLSLIFSLIHIHICQAGTMLLPSSALSPRPAIFSLLLSPIFPSCLSLQALGISWLGTGSKPKLWT